MHGRRAELMPARVLSPGYVRLCRAGTRGELEHMTTY